MDEITYVNTISVKDYNTLRAAVGWSPFKENRAQIGLNNSAFIVAAKYSDGRTVGMARVVSDGGSVAYIGDVAVLPEFQGCGIGKAIMQQVMDYIHSTLEDDFTIYAILMAAKGREAFYNKFGFVTRPTDEYGAGMHQWLKGVDSDDKQ